ncbi:MAG: CPBP family intramembrane glutamic endopeptidase, partial [Chloroflexota bacterium]
PQYRDQPWSDLTVTGYLIVLLLLFGIFMATPIFLWVKLYEKRSLQSLGLVIDKSLLRFMTGTVAGVALISAVMAILVFTGTWKVTAGTIAERPTLTVVVAIVMFLFIILQASAEEILIRGYLLQVISARWTILIGMLITSVLFGVFHMLNAGFNLIGGLNLILFGAVLALWTIQTGSLWEACGFHTAWNWTFGILYGTTETARITVFSAQVEAQTSAWLSGGTFGIEGSIFTTGLLLLAIGILLIKYPIRITTPLDVPEPVEA